MDDTVTLFKGRNTWVFKKPAPTRGVFRIKKTKIVDVIIVIWYWAKGVGGGCGVDLESRGECSWFQARDLSG
jgi:hypothetical protein